MKAPRPVKAREKYGIQWRYEADDLTIELEMLRHKGRMQYGEEVLGLGEYEHHKRAQELLWPEDDFHRWSELTLRTLIDNEVTVILGAKDSSKTYGMAKFILVDWWTFPKDTCWLVSSTEFRGAELRIWGAVKQLFNRARERFDYLPGYVLDSMHAISPTKVDEERRTARILHRGIIVVPAKKGGNNQGISALIGVKAPRLRHCSDEASVVDPSFLDAYANWHGKGDFKGIMAGNPTDLLDPLCTAARPIGDWESWTDTKKTQTWRSEFFDAAVLALDGRDTPNNDFPQTPKVRYPYLISQKSGDAVKRSFGDDSWQYLMFVAGKPNRLLATKRVITEQLCKEHFALDKAIWGPGKRHIIYGMDPAYGGGDRCIGMPIEFGSDLQGKRIIKVWPPEVIPVKAITFASREPEDQIADYLYERLSDLNIDPVDCFYDSFGRGTLGNAFARRFGKGCPTPVDSGGKPSKRPVRHDLWVSEANGRRLLRADEYYSKHITELWYRVRLIIECDQLRDLPKSVMKQGCMRIYEIVAGNKIEIESKDEMKKRTAGKSPDEFDALVIGIEGACQRGFQIERLGSEEAGPQDNSLASSRRELHSLWKSKLPSYASV